jgi:hypothetical protein
MSQQAVREFFGSLDKSDELREQYKLLTRGFFGYRPAKIVAFAAARGHQFTRDELEFVRLTNEEGFQYAMFELAGREKEYDDVSDFEPTALPHAPAAPELFHSKHGRQPG